MQSQREVSPSHHPILHSPPPLHKCMYVRVVVECSDDAVTKRGFSIPDSPFGNQDLYLEKIRVFKAGLHWNTLAWNNKIGRAVLFCWFLESP